MNHSRNRIYPHRFGATVLLAALCGTAFAVNDAPLTEKWAPSVWAPDDMAGSVNWTTPATVMKAVKLVKQGKVATLGKVYQQDAPAFDSRGWRLTIPGMPTGGPFGAQELVYNDEYVATEIGQIGTQFDGPGHIGVLTSKGNFFYNGRFTEDDNVTTYGMGPLGVEHVAKKGFVCRGVLLNAVALRGATLPIPTVVDANDPGIVTDKDIDAMIEKQAIWNIENLDFSQLVADNVSEFLFVWSPLKMKGATGSPGNPVAIY